MYRYAALKLAPPFASHYPIPFFTCQPLFLLTWRTSFSCSWCKYPSTLVPGLLSTVLPLLLHPPQGTPQIKLHIYIDDINNISRLVWYTSRSPSLPSFSLQKIQNIQRFPHSKCFQPPFLLPPTSMNIFSGASNPPPPAYFPRKPTFPLFLR
jgi:hypothetical protein